MNCPACAERTGRPDYKHTMSVSEAGYYFCHRCSTKGWLRERPATFVVPSPAPINEMPLPDGCYPLANWDGHHDARAYLSSRLGDRAPLIARAADLHACYTGRWRSRIIIPYRDSGRVLGYQGRDWTGQAVAKYLNAKNMPRMFWNIDALNAQPWVLVVEGVFDALRFLPYAIACGGKPTDTQTEQLANYTGRILICLDLDATLNNTPYVASSAVQLQRTLARAGKGSQILTLPRGEDPGSVSQAWMAATVKAALRAHA